MALGMAGLNPCVSIGKDVDGYPGLFARVPIKRGTKLFSKERYAIAVGGKTKNDLAALCHHCMSSIEDTPPVMCKKCNIISYCSHGCLEAARTLHTLECKGMKKIEDLRDKVTIEVPRPSHWIDDYEEYWPPAHAVLVARVINKGIVNSKTGTLDWLQHVCIPDSFPPVKASVFLQLEKYVRFLVPDDVSDESIHQAFLAISINTSTISTSPPGTSLLAVHNVESSLLNHVCKPNCEAIGEKDGTDSNVIYTIEDVAVGEQLCISFIDSQYYMNVREIRHLKLMNCFGIDCHCYTCTEEMIPNSKLWLLEKQKSSLITPWSLLIARQVMVEAFSTIIEAYKFPLKSASQIVELLEPSLEVQKQVLDQSNAMLIITAKTLIVNYGILNDAPKIINTFYDVLGPTGMAMMIEYGTRMDVFEVTGPVCTALLDVGRLKEFDNMFTLTRKIHPRRLSREDLCDMLHMIYPAECVYDEALWQDIQSQAEQCGIPVSAYGAIFNETVDGLLRGRPYTAVFDHAFQHLDHARNAARHACS